MSVTTIEDMRAFYREHMNELKDTLRLREFVQETVPFFAMSFREKFFINFHNPMTRRVQSAKRWIQQGLTLPENVEAIQIPVINVENALVYRVPFEYLQAMPENREAIRNMPAPWTLVDKQAAYEATIKSFGYFGNGFKEQFLGVANSLLGRYNTQQEKSTIFEIHDFIINVYLYTCLERIGYHSEAKKYLNAITVPEGMSITDIYRSCEIASDMCKAALKPIAFEMDRLEQLNHTQERSNTNGQREQSSGRIDGQGNQRELGADRRTREESRRAGEQNHGADGSSVSNQRPAGAFGAGGRNPESQQLSDDPQGMGRGDRRYRRDMARMARTGAPSSSVSGLQDRGVGNEASGLASGDRAGLPLHSGSDLGSDLPRSAGGVSEQVRPDHAPENRESDVLAETVRPAGEQPADVDAGGERSDLHEDQGARAESGQGDAGVRDGGVPEVSVSVDEGTADSGQSRGPRGDLRTERDSDGSYRAGNDESDRGQESVHGVGQSGRSDSGSDLGDVSERAGERIGGDRGVESPNLSTDDQTNNENTQRPSGVENVPSSTPYGRLSLNNRIREKSPNAEIYDTLLVPWLNNIASRADMNRLASQISGDRAANEGLIREAFERAMPEEDTPYHLNVTVDGKPRRMNIVRDPFGFVVTEPRRGAEDLFVLSFSYAELETAIRNRYVPSRNRVMSVDAAMEADRQDAQTMENETASATVNEAPETVSVEENTVSVSETSEDDPAQSQAADHGVEPAARQMNLFDDAVSAGHDISESVSMPAVEENVPSVLLTREQIIERLVRDDVPHVPPHAALEFETGDWHIRMELGRQRPECFIFNVRSAPEYRLDRYDALEQIHVIGSDGAEIANYAHESSDSVVPAEVIEEVQRVFSLAKTVNDDLMRDYFYRVVNDNGAYREPTPGERYERLLEVQRREGLTDLGETYAEHRYDMFLLDASVGGLLGDSADRNEVYGFIERGDDDAQLVQHFRDALRNEPVRLPRIEDLEAQILDVSFDADGMTVNGPEMERPQRISWEGLVVGLRHQYELEQQLKAQAQNLANQQTAPTIPDEAQVMLDGDTFIRTVLDDSFDTEAANQLASALYNGESDDSIMEYVFDILPHFSNPQDESASVFAYNTEHEYMRDGTSLVLYPDKPYSRTYNADEILASIRNLYSNHESLFSSLNETPVTRATAFSAEGDDRRELVEVPYTLSLEYMMILDKDVGLHLFDPAERREIANRFAEGKSDAEIAEYLAEQKGSVLVIDNGLAVNDVATIGLSVIRDRNGLHFTKKRNDSAEFLTSDISWHDLAQRLRYLSVTGRDGFTASVEPVIPVSNAVEHSATLENIIALQSSFFKHYEKMMTLTGYSQRLYFATLASMAKDLRDQWHYMQTGAGYTSDEKQIFSRLEHRFRNVEILANDAAPELNNFDRKLDEINILTDDLSYLYTVPRDVDLPYLTQDDSALLNDIRVRESALWDSYVAVTDVEYGPEREAKTEDFVNKSQELADLWKQFSDSAERFTYPTQDNARRLAEVHSFVAEYAALLKEQPESVAEDARTALKDVHIMMKQARQLVSRFRPFFEHAPVQTQTESAQESVSPAPAPDTAAENEQPPHELTRENVLARLLTIPAMPEILEHIAALEHNQFHYFARLNRSDYDHEHFLNAGLLLGIDNQLAELWDQVVWVSNASADSLGLDRASKEYADAISLFADLREEHSLLAQSDEALTLPAVERTQEQNRLIYDRSEPIQRKLRLLTRDLEGFFNAEQIQLMDSPQPDLVAPHVPELSVEARNAIEAGIAFRDQFRAEVQAHNDAIDAQFAARQADEPGFTHESAPVSDSAVQSEQTVPQEPAIPEMPDYVPVTEEGLRADLTSSSKPSGRTIQVFKTNLGPAALRIEFDSQEEPEIYLYPRDSSGTVVLSMAHSGVHVINRNGAEATRRAEINTIAPPYVMQEAERIAELAEKVNVLLREERETAAREKREHAREAEKAAQAGTDFYSRVPNAENPQDRIVADMLFGDDRLCTQRWRGRIADAFERGDTNEEIFDNVIADALYEDSYKSEGRINGAENTQYDYSLTIENLNYVDLSSDDPQPVSVKWNDAIAMMRGMWLQNAEHFRNASVLSLDNRQWNATLTSISAFLPKALTDENARLILFETPYSVSTFEDEATGEIRINLRNGLAPDAETLCLTTAELYDHLSRSLALTSFARGYLDLRDALPIMPHILGTSQTVLYADDVTNAAQILLFDPQNGVLSGEARKRISQFLNENPRDSVAFRDFLAPILNESLPAEPFVTDNGRHIRLETERNEHGLPESVRFIETVGSSDETIHEFSLNELAARVKGYWLLNQNGLSRSSDAINHLGDDTSSIRVMGNADRILENYAELKKELPDYTAPTRELIERGRIASNDDGNRRYYAGRLGDVTYRIDFSADRQSPVLFAARGNSIRERMTDAFSNFHVLDEQGYEVPLRDAERRKVISDAQYEELRRIYLLAQSIQISEYAERQRQMASVSQNQSQEIPLSSEPEQSVVENLAVQTETDRLADAFKQNDFLREHIIVTRPVMPSNFRATPEPEKPKRLDNSAVKLFIEFMSDERKRHFANLVVQSPTKEDFIDCMKDEFHLNMLESSFTRMVENAPHLGQGPEGVWTRTYERPAGRRKKLRPVDSPTVSWSDVYDVLRYLTERREQGFVPSLRNEIPDYSAPTEQNFADALRIENMAVSGTLETIIGDQKFRVVFGENGPVAYLGACKNRDLIPNSPPSAKLNIISPYGGETTLAHYLNQDYGTRAVYEEAQRLLDEAQSVFDTAIEQARNANANETQEHPVPENVSESGASSETSAFQYPDVWKFLPFNIGSRMIVDDEPYIITALFPNAHDVPAVSLENKDGKFLQTKDAQKRTSLKLSELYERLLENSAQNERFLELMSNETVRPVSGDISDFTNDELTDVLTDEKRGIFGKTLKEYISYAFNEGDTNSVVLSKILNSSLIRDGFSGTIEYAEATLNYEGQGNDLDIYVKTNSGGEYETHYKWDQIVPHLRWLYQTNQRGFENLPYLPSIQPDRLSYAAIKSMRASLDEFQPLGATTELSEEAVKLNRSIEGLQSDIERNRWNLRAGMSYSERDEIYAAINTNCVDIAKLRKQFMNLMIQGQANLRAEALGKPNVRGGTEFVDAETQSASQTSEVEAIEEQIVAILKEMIDLDEIASQNRSILDRNDADVDTAERSEYAGKLLAATDRLDQLARQAFQLEGIEADNLGALGLQDVERMLGTSADRLFALARGETPELAADQSAGKTENITPPTEPLVPEIVDEGPRVNSNEHNFRITDENLGVGGDKTKYQRNVEAIRTLKRIEAEDRLATPEEQNILSQYVGWGGLSGVFDANNQRWSNEYAELRELLTESEYDAARRSTMNAFYTSPVVIQEMWQALERMGLNSSHKLLDPSMGVGNFFGCLTNELSRAQLTGVELDDVSGRIARQLYPGANIHISGFEKTQFSENSFDAAVSNVPFGDIKLYDPQYDRYNFNIHDYFFAKSLDLVRPGGVVAFITSSGTLDKKDASVRNYLAERAELVAAIRLPNNAFKANAGTDVTSDIIFLQKRPEEIDLDEVDDNDLPSWLELGETKDGVPVNKYFAEHPEMVLGEMKQGVEYSLYGNADATACVAREGQNLKKDLHEALGEINAKIEEYVPEVDPSRNIAFESYNSEHVAIQNLTYGFINNELYYRNGNVFEPVDYPPRRVQRVRHMMELRDIVHELINAQLENFEDYVIAEIQKRLNDSYDSFVKKYKPISTSYNSQTFCRENSYYLLRALENYDPETKVATKTDMFFKRTIQPNVEISHVDSANDALLVSLAQKGSIDFDYMSGLTDMSVNEIRDELVASGIIFRDPAAEETGRPLYQIASEYLSGNVVSKLNIARDAADRDPGYAANVEALESVQPEPLSASDIEVRIGATWIDPQDVRDFVYEILDTPQELRSGPYAIDVRYSDLTTEWEITNKNCDRGRTLLDKTYGTDRVSAYKVIESTLNFKSITVRDKIEGEYVKNVEETAKVHEKQQAIKDAFQNWIYQSPDRRDRIVETYNRLFNNTLPREYDGSHLVFPGMNPNVKLLPHQLNAIAHILYGQNVLLAHAVGAGKTFEMVAAAMESKRLGLSHKNMFVVPNHLIQQTAAEIMTLYPSANILVAEGKDFTKKKRKEFCARIATGEYDIIVLGHSQFAKIPMSPERRQALISTQINEIVETLNDMQNNEDDRQSVKQLEKTKAKLERRLEKLNTDVHKDKGTITFEELGVDKIFIDEAHNYKNLFIYTKMNNVAGISTSDAQKSNDLYLKCRYLDEKTDGHGVVFATGTPVSNSMTEMFTMMRYLQNDTLSRLNMGSFDAWASTFGETTTTMELAPEGKGYRMRTRFAKFFNLPELMSLFKEAADIKTADTLDLKKPNAVYENIVAHPTQEQKSLIDSLSMRVERIKNGNVDPHDDNMLKITTDGRKIGLDQRLYDPDLPDDPDSKVNICVRNVYRIWKETSEKKLTQLVFCDFSTPSDKRGKKNTADAFNVYDDMKKKLIDMGIPEKEIAFIHDANTDKKKETLFNKVNAGSVRILFGSTQKMGAGTNVQRLLIANHHLDCPWRPADLEQRDGRLIRQGNTNPEVHVYRYVTEGTFDAYLYQTLETKQSFISKIMTSKTPVRVTDDMDESVLTYAEVKALCADNPLIMEKVKLDMEVQQLKTSQKNFMKQKYDMEDRLYKQIPKRIMELTNKLKGIKTALAAVKEADAQPELHLPVIGGITFEKKSEAAEKIQLYIDRQKGVNASFPLGTYRGAELRLQQDVSRFLTEEKVTNVVRIDYPGTDYCTLVELGTQLGIFTRIDNALDRLASIQTTYEHDLEKCAADLPVLREAVTHTFPKEDELREKSQRLAEVNTLLLGQKKQEEENEKEQFEDVSSTLKSSGLSNADDTSGGDDEIAVPENTVIINDELKENETYRATVFSVDPVNNWAYALVKSDSIPSGSIGEVISLCDYNFPQRLLPEKGDVLDISKSKNGNLYPAFVSRRNKAHGDGGIAD